MTWVRDRTQLNMGQAIVEDDQPTGSPLAGGCILPLMSEAECKNIPTDYAMHGIFWYPP